jgi:hypothetical protein
MKAQAKKMTAVFIFGFFCFSVLAFWRFGVFPDNGQPSRHFGL